MPAGSIQSTKIPSPTLFSELKATSWEQLIPTLTAGIVIGIIIAFVEISFAALIFSGKLSAFLPNGIGFLLLGTCVLGVVIALFSSYPGMIALAQDSPAAIMALVATGMAAQMTDGISAESLFLTVMATIMLSSIATGLIFFILGWFELGSLVRFLPYPVVGGFLAGTGLLLFKGGISVMTDVPFTLAMFHFPEILRWLPGVLFGGILLGILRHYSPFWLMPTLILAGIALFYLVWALTGIPFAQAESGGWLLGPFPEGNLWQPLTLSSFQQVEWALIPPQIGNLLTIVMIALISLLLNAGGMELVARRDIDLNQELRATGLANIAGGVAGCPVGYPTLSLSALGFKLGSHSRLVGLTAAALCGLLFLFGAAVLSLFPKVIFGGLLVFLGFCFLVEWVIDAWHTLPKTDYILVWVILAIVGAFGFLHGVVAGVIIAVALFVVKYSQINVVKHTLSGASFQSHVDRPLPQQRFLREKGDVLLIFQLQGFIFFGTAHNLLNQVRSRAADPSLPALRFVIFDFRLVTGLDSSAIQSFAKLKQFAEAQHLTLILTSLAPSIEHLLSSGGFVQKDDPVIRLFTDLDHGMEWCEEQILHGPNSPEEASAAQRHFFESTYNDILKFIEKQELFEIVVTDMMPYLEKQTPQSGEVLIRQGELSDALYFIESGKVTAQCEHADGSILRLSTMGFGSVIGQTIFYLQEPATETVVVTQPGTIYRLSITALESMTENNPQLAALFHKLMAQRLGERLRNTHKALESLLQ
ncbi:MAG: SulP family inorganic anion transporter [bacterium]|jgi:SulP family sulfate permease|nr:SulP family inorganic anion transporter [bacterium]